MHQRHIFLIAPIDDKLDQNFCLLACAFQKPYDFAHIKTDQNHMVLWFPPSKGDNCYLLFNYFADKKNHLDVDLKSTVSCIMKCEPFKVDMSN